MLDVNKITGNNLYVANSSKENGSTLSAEEWNALSNAAALAHTTINSIIDNAGTGSGSGSSSDATGVISVSSKGNTTISATKHINIEPAYVADGGTGTYGDVQIKPGDDITLESHHRASDKRDEITIKTSDGVDGSKAPVKMQLIASNVTLSTKGKVVPSGSNDKPEVMNVNVTTGEGKGYLKVRARAIDLRCEEHGGIALQPKGTDSDGHMNKIKFEHGGGDGLEFGTFNAEKTSIFTDEYRFNKDGVWKMATRETEPSDKVDASDDTTNYKYVKPTDDNISGLVDEPSNYEAPDDFYDLINVADEQCTTRDIIRTAHAMNGTGGIHTKITDKGNLEIETEVILVVDSSATAKSDLGTLQTSGTGTIDFTKGYMSLADFLTCFGTSDANTINAAFSAIESGEALSITIPSYSGTSSVTLVLKKIARGINIESAAGIKLKGILDFGSTFNFGETDNGIEVQYKLTKKNKTKDCGMLKVVGVNNHASNTLTVNDTVIPSGETATVAEASVLDIINTTHKLGKYSNDAIGGPYYECVLSDSQPESGQDVFDGIPETMPGYFVNGGVYSLGYILSHFTDMKNNADFENVVRNMGAGDYMDINVRTGSNTTETKYITFNETPHPDGDVSFDDILTYIRWAKANNEGPWATQP